ncbi:MAG TPA: hypothetical protein VE219_00445, partial [Candidatus Sulfotelmatobacter sp.]|nr:hypothetical protein [Candidatus Sulfotelmatobacter sp.]
VSAAAGGFNLPAVDAQLGGVPTARSSADPMAAQPPSFCPQLVLSPLVAGCQSLLGPIMRRALAPTGMPLLIGLAGLLLVALGWALHRRSRRAGARRRGSPARRVGGPLIGWHPLARRRGRAA